MANNTQAKFSWGSALGMGALLITGCAVVIVLATFLFGYVTGYEFNPNTFERRMFGYYEIPLLRLQVTPLYRISADGDLERLVQSDYLTPNKGAPETWHLISFRRNARAAQPTDAQILARYLDARNDTSSSYWHGWSQKHPELAAVLWPEVVRLARLELYTMIPQLFEAARQADDAKSFQKDLRQLQTTQLKSQADRLKKRADLVESEELKTKFQERAAELETASETADADLQKEPRPVKEKAPVDETKPVKPAESVTKS